MYFFDTHCHLNFEVFDGRVDEIIESAKAVGVTKFVIPGTDIPTSKKALAIAEKFDGVYAAVGVHPHHLFGYVEYKIKNVEQEIEKLEKILQQNSTFYNLHSKFPVVAIGEIGLDRYEYKKTKYKDYQIGEEFIDLQKELFIAQLLLAIKHDLSVIVHNREAKDDLLSVLSANWNDHFKKRLVIHCCEPDLEILDFAKDHDLFIGVDGDVTWTKPSFAKASAGKQEFIKKVPLSMLVLETDSPFLAPRLRPAVAKAMAGRQGFGGQARPPGDWPNTPANIPIIAQFVADLKGESVENIARQTSQNALKLFNFT